MTTDEQKQVYNFLANLATFVKQEWDKADTTGRVSYVFSQRRDIEKLAKLIGVELPKQTELNFGNETLPPHLLTPPLIYCADHECTNIVTREGEFCERHRYDEMLRWQDRQKEL